MSEWQPIETAPRDGTVVLLGLWCYGPDMASAAWNGYYWDTRYLDGEHYDMDRSAREFGQPSHWMPLPPPPPDAAE